MVEEATMMAFFVIFLTGAFISVKTNFVQFKSMFKIVKKLFYTNTNENNSRLNPRQAMFLTLSTTIGVGSVVGPVVAVNFGGPGALLWFMLSCVVGSGVVYAEVLLAFKNRLLSSKTPVFGPMAHLRKISNWSAVGYAVSVSILLGAWNASQSFILCKIASHSLPISQYVFTILMALSVVIINAKGISWIREIVDKLVPIMISAYVCAIIMNIFINAPNVIPTLKSIITGFFSLNSCISGVGSFSIIEACRWGVGRSMAAIEIGCGTSSIAHSLSSGKNAKEQAQMAILAAYINCIVGFLSAFSVMVSNTIERFPHLTDIDLIEKAFLSTPYNMGVILIRVAIFLFAYGTILGNGFNGKVCFDYFVNTKYRWIYHVLTGLAICSGQLFSLKGILECADILFIIVVTIQMGGVVYWCINDQKIISQ